MFSEQENGGKVFFIDGTGAWGNPTPGNVAYGASKRALTQLKVRSPPSQLPFTAYTLLAHAASLPLSGMFVRAVRANPLSLAQSHVL